MDTRGIIRIRPVNGKWELFLDGNYGFCFEEETRDEAIRKGRIAARRLKLQLHLTENPAPDSPLDLNHRIWSVLTPKYFVMKKIMALSVMALLFLSCGENATDDKKLKEMENPDKGYSHDSISPQPGDTAKKTY